MKVQAAPPGRFSWLKDKTGCAITDDFRAIEAIDRKGRIRGMVGFSAWTDSAVFAHMAVESPMVWRHLLGPALAYPFGEAGREVLIACINSTNAKSLAMVAHLGFDEVGRIPGGVRPGADLVFLQLRKDNCSYWLRQKEAA